MTIPFPKIHRSLKMLFMVAICSVLYACDCNQNVSGTVLDKTSKQPIDSAYTQNATKSLTHAYTNKTGYFELQSISGGFRKCPPMKVAVTKAGYEIQTIEIENGTHDTIYLEKIR